MIRKAILTFSGFVCLSFIFGGVGHSRADSPPAEAYGIGVVLAKASGGFLVGRLLPNSPAASSGSIAQGDLIVEVAQSNAPSVSLRTLNGVADAVALIRGPKGSVVRLTIVPQATNVLQEHVVSIVRGEIGVWLSLPTGSHVPSVHFLTLPDKKPFALQDDTGKFVILDFWATWCGPCLGIMPQLQNEAASFRIKTNLIWVTVSLDENPDIAIKRLQSNGWDKTRNLWGNQNVARGFGIHGIPEMYVIDPGLKVIYHGFPLESNALVRLLEKSTVKS